MKNSLSLRFIRRGVFILPQLIYRFVLNIINISRRKSIFLDERRALTSPHVSAEIKMYVCTFVNEWHDLKVLLVAFRDTLNLIYYDSAMPETKRCITEIR